MIIKNKKILFISKNHGFTIFVMDYGMHITHGVRCNAKRNVLNSLKIKIKTPWWKESGNIKVVLHVLLFKKKIHFNTEKPLVPILQNA